MTHEPQLAALGAAIGKAHYAGGTTFRPAANDNLPPVTARGQVISQERLQYLLDYNPKSGLFTWRNPTSRRVRAGRIAGNIDSMGYVQMSLDNRDYRGHRLAWLYVHGHYPENEVDHVNMVRSDNRIDNLREATREQNARNRIAYKSSTTGFKGVIRSRDKFSARITVNRKPIHLGQFDTAEEANAAYEAAANRYFGDFARAS